MKPSVEKGLASHSSIMVASRDFAHGCENGYGWINKSHPRKTSARTRVSTRTNPPRISLSFQKKTNKMKFPLQVIPVSSQIIPEHHGHSFSRNHSGWMYQE